ncbi:MAG: hypothetical protein V3W44_01930 [Dehalococcoidales bacterium]
MTVPLGEPIIVYPYRHEGCVQRVLVQLARVGVSLVLFGSGLLAGYIVWGIG